MSLPRDEIESTVKLSDPIWFREWFKIIMRSWAQHLTLHQLALVLFIYDRTAAWGKEWELIRYSSFVDGITSKDGSKRYAAGVCSSQRVAMRVMDELVDCGAVLRRRSRDGYWWALNYEWNCGNMRNLSGDMTEMTGHDMSKVSTHDMSKTTGHKYSYAMKGNAMQKKLLSRREAGATSVSEALDRAREKNKAAVDRKVEKKKGRMNAIDVARHWTTAMKSAPWAEVKGMVPGSLYLVKRDAQALKSYSDRFAKAYPKEAFREFVTWVIHHWPGLRTELFAWMTKAPSPEAPAALFLIKWADRFEEKFMQRIAFEKRLTMTPEDREFSRLVKSGMSPMEARQRAAGVPRLVPGGNTIKYPVTETVVIRRVSRSFSNRNRKEHNISLPSLKDTTDYDYE